MKTIISAATNNPLVTALVVAFFTASGSWAWWTTTTLSEIKIELANRPDRKEIGHMIANDSPYQKHRPVLQLELQHIREGQEYMQVRINEMNKTLTEVRDSVIRNGRHE